MSETAVVEKRREARIAWVALVGHVVLLVFSGIAFATVLAPPAPAWLQTPENPRVAAFMFMFGGQTTVVLGAIAGWLLTGLVVARAMLAIAPANRWATRVARAAGAPASG